MSADPMERVLDQIVTDIADLSRKADHIDRSLTDVKLNYVTKQEYNEDRKTRRAIIMWGLGIIVSLGIATWTIIASRQPMVIEQMSTWIGLLA